MTQRMAGGSSDDLGQLFMVGFHGLRPAPALIELIEREGVGGVILFSRNCQSAPQVSRLTRDLQAIARGAGRPPLLIAIDQENGLVQRLGAAGAGLPGAMALGATRSARLTFDVARATGEVLRALGITLNFAPVADIASNPANPIIGVRSFGQDPHLVARLTAAAVRGYHAAGVAATLKHFPGHGDTSVDSHLALPSLPHTPARLEEVELVPFRAGVAAGAQAVMLAHLHLPGVTPGEDLPGSLSPAVARLARGALGFDGVLITDCLEMGAVAKTVGVARAARLALCAGADIVLVSHTIGEQRAALAAARAALASGDLPGETARRAIARVRALKERVLAWERLPEPIERASVSAPARARLGVRAYRRAVTLVRDRAGQIPVRLPERARVALVAYPPARMSQASDRTYPHETLVEHARLRHAASLGILAGRGPGATPVEEALTSARDADLIIVTLLNAARDARQARFLRRLMATGRPLIAIAAGDPYDAAAFPAVDAFLATYEATPGAFRAAVDVIFGVCIPRGRLPVELPAPPERA